MAQPLDLTADAQTLVAGIGPLPDLEPAERPAAIATWRGRMINEHVSARVFGAMLGQAMAAGLSPRRQTQLAEFACEELRHARQCAAVVLALGGQARAELPVLQRVPDHADADPLQALLRNVLSVCCLSETVAVALIRAETLQIGPPGLRAALDAILADEVGHAQFGWSLFADLHPLSADQTGPLSAYLDTALVHLVEHELRHLPDHDGLGERLQRVGVCSGRRARLLLKDTIDQVIVPGLRRFGIAVA
ncbi:MAG: ferritin-like domain-containing protein [Deltaproteobacteria bacterium]|nr:ferritin-like domain-containing protein [Deltaproteobacteria bacterium]